jgi:NosR/NirI family transcriptional regulator, nitrous oxide reductase regulator
LIYLNDRPEPALQVMRVSIVADLPRYDLHDRIVVSEESQDEGHSSQSRSTPPKPNSVQETATNDARSQIAIVRKRSRAMASCLLLLLAVLALGWSTGRARAETRLPEFVRQLPPAQIFPGADRFGPVEGNPPAAPAFAGDKLLGYVYLNSDVVNSTGYSGKPIIIVVALALDGTIVGAKLVEHHEPIVLVGIPPAKVENFIHGYVGLNFQAVPSTARSGPPVDIVSGATVTMMVIGDSITRSAIQVARSHGLGGIQPTAAASTIVKTIDESQTATEDWQALVSDGSVRRFLLSLADINQAFEKAENHEAAAHPEEGSSEDPFIDLYVGLASVPAIGRSLLGNAEYERLKQSLKPGQQAIIIAGNGRYSFKGSGYVRGGIFDRIEVIQGENGIRFRDRNHTRLGDLSAQGAPSFAEIGLFTTPDAATLDPTAPWRLQLLVQRAIGARDKAFLTFDLDYVVPDKYLRAERAPVAVAASTQSAATAATTVALAAANDTLDQPLWQRMWLEKPVKIGIIVAALAILSGIFFFQDFLVRRPVLYDRVRLTFLVFTLVWIGWYAQAQLSVVNVLTFANALRTDFKWDYFLMDPLIFILWAAVAVSLLFWNRGAFCGWLCPFGALQELTNRAAKLLHVPQIRVPFGLHQRLWAIKYVIFLGLFGLSLYSLSFAEQLSEIEPFKTAIVLRFMRTWPFAAFAGVLLVAGLFIERFFCRYLCPLGAALAIPARLRMFDWLRRYRECGSPCQRCAGECPVQAIHPEGQINPNECIQCLHCQMLYHHDHKCPVMIQKRLKTEKRLATMSPSMRPASTPERIAAAAERE